MSNDRLNRLLEEYRFTTSKWFELQKIIRQLKLMYYLFQRPVYSYLLSKTTSFRDIKQSYNIDRILLNDGGTFKEYIYNLCNKIRSLRGSSILVPGCGYGQHLITLASFKPKLIVACDLYEYPEEWDFVQELIKKNGTDIIFLKGSIENSIIHDKAPFDWLITDAVLEHVNDLKPFLKECHTLLKDDGWFYAGFGPIWYGPGGDHIDWGDEGLFNHLLCEGDYDERLLNLDSSNGVDSTEGVFMVKNKLFSYLRAKEYLDALEKCGFLKEILWVKFAMPAWEYLKKHPDKEILLRQKGSTLFDLYSKGLIIWAKKI